MKENTKKELLDVIETGVISYIMRILTEAGRPITYEEAKTLLRHLAKKLYEEENEIVST